MEPKRSTNVILIIVLVVILAFAGWWYLDRSTTSSISSTQSSDNAESTDVTTQQPIDTRPEERAATTNVYESPNGYSLQVPTDAQITEEPPIYSNSAITSIEGAFGTLCISPGYGCGGIGMQGWTSTQKVITTASGNDITFTVWRRESDNLVVLSMTSINSRPAVLTQDAQIQLKTTEDGLSAAESILTSIQFLQ